MDAQPILVNVSETAGRNRPDVAHSTCQGDHRERRFSFDKRAGTHACTPVILRSSIPRAPSDVQSDARCAELLQQCASLTHLKFDVYDSALLISLPHLGSLQKLELQNIWGLQLAGLSGLPFVQLCPSVRSLSLAFLQTDTLHDLLSTHMTLLTSLSVSGIEFTGSENLESWSENFAGLQSLTALRLDRISDMALILQALSKQLPLLTRLFIKFYDLKGLLTTSLMPWEDQIESLLLQRPALHVNVSIRSLEAERKWSDVQSWSVDTGNWHSAHQRLRTLVQKHPQRVILVLREKESELCTQFI
jgi:hypothetical protein